MEITTIGFGTTNLGPGELQRGSRKHYSRPVKMPDGSFVAIDSALLARGNWHTLGRDDHICTTDKPLVQGDKR